MKINIIAFVGIVLSGAYMVQAAEWVTVPVVYGGGRQLSVRPGEPPGPEAHDWLYFPPFQEAPATPAQDAILLTDADPLEIAVPMFAFRPWLANFDTNYTRLGNQLHLDGFILLTGAVTATIYGPHEYLEQIGSLPPGTYSLTVRKFMAWDGSATRDFGAFKAEPEGYAASHGVNLDLVQQTLEFTVVPEPGTAVLLVVALGFAPLTLLFRRISQ